MSSLPEVKEKSRVRERWWLGMHPFLLRREFCQLPAESLSPEDTAFKSLRTGQLSKATPTEASRGGRTR